MEYYISVIAIMRSEMSLQETSETVAKLRRDKALFHILGFLLNSSYGRKRASN